MDELNSYLGFFEAAFLGFGQDQYNVNVLSASSTQMVMENPDTGFITTIDGSGFTFDAMGVPTGGTFTSLSLELNGDTKVVVTATNGGSWSLVQADQALHDAGNGNNGPLQTLFETHPVTLDYSMTNDPVEFHMFGGQIPEIILATAPVQPLVYDAHTVTRQRFTKLIGGQQHNFVITE